MILYSCTKEEIQNENDPITSEKINPLKEEFSLEKFENQLVKEYLKIDWQKGVSSDDFDEYGTNLNSTLHTT